MKKITFFLLSVAMLSTGPTLRAQFSGADHGPVQNVTLLKPPSGSKVAIVVFEDLGCPACARAHPIELSAAKAANVPLLRYDFPIAGHIWTFQGAVCARYIQNKISPKLADEYRSDVFEAQRRIASKDDLQQFTQLWLEHHGQQLPFVMDPDGSLASAVKADYDLGRRLNVSFTPTVIVVTSDQQQIVCGTGRTGADDPDSCHKEPAEDASVAERNT
jgi:protein-disulfide isomerase